MRVLIVHDYGTASGGAEHMSLMLRAHLRARGHTVRLFTSSSTTLGLPVLADDTCFGTRSALRHFIQVANPSAVRRLREVLGTFQPDVVHVRMFSTQLSPLILPLLRSRPSLLHVVNYNLICPRNTKTLPDGASCGHQAGSACRGAGCVGWRGVARFAVQRRLTDLSVFDAVIANSEWVQRRLEADGVTVDGYIWNGVPARTPRPPLDDPPLVGFAGRFEWKKGIDVLVSALRRVVDVLPAARLLLLGDGPERLRIARLVRQLDLGQSVEMPGFREREEAEALLAPAWVQVVPSRWEEPFGLVAAEAMMRGTAAVVSDGGGLSEQVREGVTGYRVRPGDPDALAATLLRILASRELAESLGAAARTHALDNFCEERVVDRFEVLYRELAANGSEGMRNTSGGASHRRQRNREMSLD